jgi:hypothetical protein
LGLLRPRTYARTPRTPFYTCPCMFLAKKSKANYVEIGEHATLLARVNRSASPLIVEELKEVASTDREAIANWVKASDGKGATGFLHSTCGVYPLRRLVRRHTLDLKRIKDPTYFNELYTQQFRIEPEKYAIRPMNPADGGDYDLGKGTNREVLFCGLPSEDVIESQQKLLDLGIYPERLELSTVATLGGVINYLKLKQSKTPVLVLEMGEEVTQSFIVTSDGVDTSRAIQNGISGMIPVVQKELGLKDEEAAKKLFYSNTFDFTSMGGVLVKKLLKELQSSIGFYEVQTGQSIGHVLCTQLPASLGWLNATMASAVGVTPLKVEMGPWLQSLNIKVADGVVPNQPDERWLGLFSLIASYNSTHGA